MRPECAAPTGAVRRATGRRVDGTGAAASSGVRKSSAPRPFPSTLPRLPRRPPRRPASQKRAPPTRPRRDQRRAPRDHHRFQRRAPRARSCRCTQTSSRHASCHRARPATLHEQPHAHAPDAPPTCGLSTRSCAFGDSSRPQLHQQLQRSREPAPGSVCPAFAFKLPMRQAPQPRRARQEDRRHGSPPRSGRPTPCPCRAPPAAPSARRQPRICERRTSTPCCACPLGAVRLAAPPVLPHCAAEHAAAAPASPTLASDRVDGLAARVPVRPRVKRVRPTAHRREAGDRVAMHRRGLEDHVHTRAQRRLALDALQRTHAAVAADERRRARGVVRRARPLQPSANETRPHVTEHAEAGRRVHAATCGRAISTLPNSLCPLAHVDSDHATKEATFVMPAACSAAYPRSSSCRCWGSIADASAAEMLKKPC